MHELNAILGAWRSVENEDSDAVLATVVHVQGSAYRRPGARMLILSDGSRVGSISGGCLEGDVCKKATWLTSGGQASLRVYDTGSGDDAIWEFGLGCNGVVHVLLERITSEPVREALRFLDGCRSAGKECVLATVIRASEISSASIGDRLLLARDREIGGTLHDPALRASLFHHAEDCWEQRKSRLVHLDDCDVFVEWVGPPVQLVIFGAGHDAIPLVSIARQLGWHVTVADGRPAYARSDRFPSADRVVVLNSAGNLAAIDVGPESVVVLMTHNYPQDRRLLEELLPLSPRYLGLLGSRSRGEQLLHEIGWSADDSSIHSPVGLDIGADNPESIALAIAAEIQAALNMRSGTMLKFRRESIHPAADEVGNGVLSVLPAADYDGCVLFGGA